MCKRKIVQMLAEHPYQFIAITYILVIVAAFFQCIWGGAGLYTHIQYTEVQMR